MYVQPVTDSEQHLPLYTIDSKVPQVFSLLTVEQFEVQALLCFVPLKSFDSHRRLAFGSLVLVLVLGHVSPRPFRVAASTWRRGSTHGRLVTQQYSDDLPCGVGWTAVWPSVVNCSYSPSAQYGELCSVDTPRSPKDQSLCQYKTSPDYLYIRPEPYVLSCKLSCGDLFLRFLVPRSDTLTLPIVNHEQSQYSLP